MHVGSTFKVKDNPNNLVVTVTDISSNDWTTLIDFETPEGTDGRLSIHEFRDRYVPAGPVD